MDQMKQNGFMIVVGLLVALAAGLTGFRLFGIGGDIDSAKVALDSARATMETEIIAKGEDAPNKTWPDVYMGRATEVKRVLKECYKQYGETDDKLEMWEEGGKPKAADKPPGGDGPWRARYYDRGTALKKALEDKNIKVGVESKAPVGPLGGGPVKPPTDEGGLAFVEPADMRGDLQAYQKQWWIQERFVQAVLATPNVARVEKVYFQPEAGPTDAAAPTAPTDGSAPPTTYHKPSAIKVTFTVQLMFGDVAKFVTNLLKLDPASDLPIRFRNVDLRVVKLAMLDTKSTDVEEIIEEVPGDGFDETKWKPSTDPSPKPVRVEVSAEVLDFDIPKAVR